MHFRRKALLRNFQKCFCSWRYFFGENPISDLENKNFDTFLFLKKVPNPEEFGVAKIVNNQIVEIEENKSNQVQSSCNRYLYI